MGASQLDNPLSAIPHVKPKPKAKAAKSKPVPPPPDCLEIPRQSAAEPMADALGRAALRPSVKAAITIQKLSKTMLREVRLMPLVNELQAQADQANKGNLQRTEAMLMIQAHTLDSIFNEMARIATLNIGEYMGAVETYMRLALKAQGQCRATLETLAQIKNPAPVAFFKQANIANGPQQVNNGAGAAPRAENIENQPNEILALEQRDGSTQVDFGATATAIGAHSNVAPLGAGKRTANGSGKG